MTNLKSDLYIRQNHGFHDDHYLGLIDYSSSHSPFEAQHPWAIESCCQYHTVMEGDSQQNLRPTQFPSTNIFSPFVSPASPFLVDDPCMALQQHYDLASGNSQILSFQCAEDDTGRVGSADQPGPKSVVNSRLSSYQHIGHPEPSSHNGSKNPFEDQNIFDWGLFSAPSKENEDFKSSISSVKEQQSSESSGGVCDYFGQAQSSRTRIKWTEELHKKFVDCVNYLGGADKATPRAILNLMGSEGLTIYHVKSHLQKYRTGKYMPDVEGESDKSTTANDMPQLYLRTSMQIKEALELQLECEKHLREQLEIQQSMQLMIEGQMEQLKRMIELKTNRTLNYTDNLNGKTSQNDPSSSSKGVQVSTSNAAH